MLDLSFSLCFIALFTKGYCLYIMACLREPLPFRLKVKPKCLGIADPFLTCERLQEEEINTSTPQSRLFQEIFKRLLGLFTLLPNLLHLSVL